MLLIQLMGQQKTTMSFHCDRFNMEGPTLLMYNANDITDGPSERKHVLGMVLPTGTVFSVTEVK